MINSAKDFIIKYFRDEYESNQERSPSPPINSADENEDNFLAFLNKRQKYAEPASSEILKYLTDPLAAEKVDVLK